jgi:hypothetical protein
MNREIEIKVQKISNNRWDYIWDDDLGTHNYILNLEDPDQHFFSEPGKLKYIKCSEIPNGRVYSWKDNFGFHQYYAEC